jgi:hypothetical protein
MPPSTIYHPYSRPIFAYLHIRGFPNYNDKHIATYLMDVVRAVGSGKQDYLGIKEAVTATILQDPGTHSLTQ